MYASKDYYDWHSEFPRAYYRELACLTRGPVMGSRNGASLYSAGTREILAKLSTNRQHDMTICLPTSEAKLCRDFQ